MPSHFCLTIRFLQPYSHARGDGGEPEWPPSPLRVYQALVSACAARWNERQALVDDKVVAALRWLEGLSAPEIMAPAGSPAQAPYRSYVPDNTGDLAAGTWSRGDSTKIIKRTEKDIRPTRLKGEAAHYLFDLSDSDCPHVKVLSAAARSITHLGWGVDMVVADGAVLSAEEAAKLDGERWQPSGGSDGIGLRIPVEGTLDDLLRRHAAFLGRICRDDKGRESFNPVPPLSAFRVENYRKATQSAAPGFAAFSLLKPDASGYRPFDPVKRGLVVAGMLRNAAKQAAEEAGKESLIAGFVLGHGEAKGAGAHLPVDGPRLAYIPLPSVEARGGGREVAGGIRRALVVVSRNEGDGELAWLRQRLSGRDLTDENSKQKQAVLSLLPNNDKMVRRYTQAASVWATVSPVVLPGYDDPKHYRRRLKSGVENAGEQKRLLAKLEQNVDELLRKAITQAGYSPQLAQHARLEWGHTGYWPGTELASKYETPLHLRKFPRLHVRLTWRDKHGQPLTLPGPLCLGSGRYFGLGLFLAEKAKGGAQT
jgi:CRISPR-associated protein Csb2